MVDDENIDRFTAKVFLSNRKIIWKNLLGGIAWGVGSVIGATLVVALVLSILRTIGFVPVIGDFVSQIVDYVESRRFPIR
ncbi:hypothetical protein HYS97_02050 [Candidatus Daviesbacteria bacterium]|nr:hypothetical protein [Candidatus Daviesbacteria bacterium]